MELSYITKDGLTDLLQSLDEQYSIFLPFRKGNTRFYKSFSNSHQFKGSNGGGPAIGEIRACEPIKVFYFKAKQKVSENFDDEIPSTDKKALCVLGVKACDLKSLRILDKVFLESDYQDPFYEKARRENLIISADCTFAAETCFCTALQVKPHPIEEFDLNLSELDGGYLAEIGSDKGSHLVDSNSHLFGPADPAQIDARDSLREKVIAEAEKNIGEFNIPRQDQLHGIIKKNYESEIWGEEGENCVECGACNTVCPTCHCFLLFDHQSDEGLNRFRLWDSCLIKDFAQVAGGANPRPQLWMRLRNRFEKKFDFFPETNGIYACTGCGRCIRACPGKIDIRNVLRRNVERVHEQ